MKNLSLGLVLILLLSTFYSCRHHKLNEGVIRKTKYKESIKKAYQDLGVFCVTNFIPGMAVCVSIDNEIVWADGFGLANKELNAPATPLTKFRIGDVSQVITALTAAKMAEEKRIDIDKPISTYIPEMAGKDTITIRQLAAHSAGIREEMDPDRNGLINTSLTKGIERFINDPLLYKPGAYTLKTGLGFDLIGRAMENADNNSFYKIVKSTLLDTLHLDGIALDYTPAIIENRSACYDRDMVARVVNATTRNFSYREPSMGYIASVTDLTKLGNLLLQPGFFKQETLDLFFTPFKLEGNVDSNQGFGFLLGKDSENHPFYGQLGNITGGSAILIIFPEKKMVIAMASNLSMDSGELPILNVAKTFMDNMK